MGSYQCDADPTNTYLSFQTGTPQGVIWDDTSQTGDTDVVTSPGPALAYLEVLTSIEFLPGCETTIDWSGTLALDTVTVDLIFEDDSFAEIARFTGTNSASTDLLTVTSDAAVSVPAGGLVKVEFTHDGTPTNITYGGDIALTWGEEGGWNVGFVGWPDEPLGG